MSDSSHWQDCWLIHPACCVAEVRRLKGELDKYRVPVTTCTHATYIPCDSSWYTHHGDEPPSAAL